MHEHEDVIKNEELIKHFAEEFGINPLIVSRAIEELITKNLGVSVTPDRIYRILITYRHELIKKSKESELRQEEIDIGHLKKQCNSHPQLSHMDKFSKEAFFGEFPSSDITYRPDPFKSKSATSSLQKFIEGVEQDLNQPKEVKLAVFYDSSVDGIASAKLFREFLREYLGDSFSRLNLIFHPPFSIMDPEIKNSKLSGYRTIVLDINYEKEAQGVDLFIDHRSLKDIPQGCIVITPEQAGMPSFTESQIITTTNVLRTVSEEVLRSKTGDFSAKYNWLAALSIVGYQILKEEKANLYPITYNIARMLNTVANISSGGAELAFKAVCDFPMDGLCVFQNIFEIFNSYTREVKAEADRIYERQRDAPYIIELLPAFRLNLPGFKGKSYLAHHIIFELSHMDQMEHRERLIVLAEAQGIEGETRLRLFGMYPREAIRETNLDVSELLAQFGGGGVPWGAGTRKGIRLTGGETIKELFTRVKAKVEDYFDIKVLGLDRELVEGLSYPDPSMRRKAISEIGMRVETVYLPSLIRRIKIENDPEIISELKQTIQNILKVCGGIKIHRVAEQQLRRQLLRDIQNSPYLIPIRSFSLQQIIEEFPLEQFVTKIDEPSLNSAAACIREKFLDRINRKEDKIAIFSHDDGDGLASAILLKLFLKEYFGRDKENIEIIIERPTSVEDPLLERRKREGYKIVVLDLNYTPFAQHIDLLIDHHVQTYKLKDLLMEKGVPFLIPECVGAVSFGALLEGRLSTTGNILRLLIENILPDRGSKFLHQFGWLVAVSIVADGMEENWKKYPNIYNTAKIINRIATSSNAGFGLVYRSLDRFIERGSIYAFLEMHQLFQLLMQRIEEVADKIYNIYENEPYIFHFLDPRDSVVKEYIGTFEIVRPVKYEIFERDRRAGRKRLIILGEVQDAKGRFVVKLSGEYQRPEQGEPETDVNLDELMGMFGGGGYKYSGGTREGIKLKPGQTILELIEEIKAKIERYLAEKGLADVSARATKVNIDNYLRVNFQDPEFARLWDEIAVGSSNNIFWMWLADILRGEQDIRIGDLGTGTAKAMEPIASKINRGEFIGIDLNDAMLRVAGAKFSRRFPHIIARFVKGDITKLNEVIPDEKEFNAFTARFSLNFVDLDQVLPVVYEKLKSGGRLIFNVFSGNYYGETKGLWESNPFYKALCSVFKTVLEEEIPTLNPEQTEQLIRDKQIREVEAGRYEIIGPAITQHEGLDDKSLRQSLTKAGFADIRIEPVSEMYPVEEKLKSSLLTKSIPFYWGVTNVFKDDIPRRIKLVQKTYSMLPSEYKTGDVKLTDIFVCAVKPCSIAETKKKIEEQKDIIDSFQARLAGRLTEVKYIVIDKDAVPDNQRYILDSGIWSNYIKKLFPGIEMLIIKSSDDKDLEKLSNKGVNRQNCLIICCQDDLEKLQPLNTRLLLVQKVDQNQLFPLERLLLLGTGLAGLDESDINGSPLVSSIQRLYQNITQKEISAEFIEEYIKDPNAKALLLLVTLPPLQRFSEEQIKELYEYSLSVLSSV